MSTVAIAAERAPPAEGSSSGLRLACAFVAVAIVAASLAGWAPLGFSVATVFLFAGPHNWMEACYFMARMPGRWGKLAPYYTTGLVGIGLLGASSFLWPSLARSAEWSAGDWLVGVASWNTLFVLWVLTLIEMRRHQLPKRDWPWAWPIGMTVIAANWCWPLGLSLALVYAHPLVALWFLDGEIARRKPGWQIYYRRALWIVPALLVALVWRLLHSADLAGDDILSAQIAHHAGKTVLPGLSSHLLVACHTYLEMIHYFAWIVVIPLVSARVAPWSLSNVSLAKISVRWKQALGAALVAGACLTIALWAGFLINYPLTRDIYFSIAILHVLAEIPFLLRLT